MCVLVAAPVALATGEGSPFSLGKRNPTKGNVTKESQVATNGTATVANLSADKVDGLDSTDFVTATAAASKFATHDDVKFAQTNLGRAR